MHSPSEIFFWIYFLYFIIATLISFFIPGNLFVRKLKLNIFSEIVLSFVLGYVIWSLLGFLFGYLYLRFFSYIFLALCLFIWIRLNPLDRLRKIKLNLPDPRITFIVFIGTLIQLSSVWFNGIKFKEGLYFCCGVPDTLFHLALTNELVKNFPPNEPAISSMPLHNYHFLSNLAIADLIRVFHLPLINTQYQYMTVLFSILLGLTAIVLFDILNLGEKFKSRFVFLLYFSGDIIFLLPLLSKKGIDFSYTTLENASSLWISPPRFYSIVVLLAGLSFFVLWIKRKNLLTGVIMAIVLGSLIGFKIYTSAIILSGVFVLSIVYVLRKQIRLLFPIILLICISLILYLPINYGAGGLIFTGFWRFEDFIVQPSLGLSHLELARQIYSTHHNIPRVFLFDLFFGLVYVVFSAGILIFGFIQTKKSLSRIPKDLNILLLSGLIATCTIGFFFIQKIGGSNSSQFLISLYIIGAIYACLSIVYWSTKFPSRLIIIFNIFIILLLSTRVLHDTFLRIDRIEKKEGIFISNKKLDSYKYFLSTPKDSIVVLDNENNLDCLFIPFIGNRSVYKCAGGSPADRGINLKKIPDLNNLLSSETKQQKESFYIYADKESAMQIQKNKLTKVYENSSATIYTYLK